MRSAARRSPPPSPRSASTTPTSVRSGKWWPLAMIWVPIRMSTAWLSMASTSAAAALASPAVSLVITASRASGRISASSSARRSTPGPEAVSRPTDTAARAVVGAGTA